jgi:hypothetical protein
LELFKAARIKCSVIMSCRSCFDPFPTVTLLFLFLPWTSAKKNRIKK